MYYCPVCGAGPFWTIPALLAHAAVCTGPVFPEPEPPPPEPPPPEPPPGVITCPYCGQTVAESEFQYHLDLYHLPYRYPFTVSVTNTSIQGGAQTEATIEIVVSARLGGYKVVSSDSYESFSLGQTKSWPFGVDISRQYFGQTMTIDVLAMSPDGGIIGSSTKYAAV